MLLDIYLTSNRM